MNCPRMGISLIRRRLQTPPLRIVRCSSRAPRKNRVIRSGRSPDLRVIAEAGLPTELISAVAYSALLSAYSCGGSYRIGDPSGRTAPYSLLAERRTVRTRASEFLRDARLLVKGGKETVRCPGSSDKFYGPRQVFSISNQLRNSSLQCCSLKAHFSQKKGFRL